MRSSLVLPVAAFALSVGCAPSNAVESAEENTSAAVATVKMPVRCGELEVRSGQPVRFMALGALNADGSVAQRPIVDGHWFSRVYVGEAHPKYTLAFGSAALEQQFRARYAASAVACLHAPFDTTPAGQPLPIDSLSRVTADGLADKSILDRSFPEDTRFIEGFECAVGSDVATVTIVRGGPEDLDRPNAKTYGAGTTRPTFRFRYREMRLSIAARVKFENSNETHVIEARTMRANAAAAGRVPDWDALDHHTFHPQTLEPSAQQNENQILHVSRSSGGPLDPERNTESYLQADISGSGATAPRTALFCQPRTFGESELVDSAGELGGDNPIVVLDGNDRGFDTLR